MQLISLHDRAQTQESLGCALTQDPSAHTTPGIATSKHLLDFVMIHSLVLETEQADRNH